MTELKPGVTQWHCFRFEGVRGSDNDARSGAVAVPPLVTRDWLSKPKSLRRGVHVDLASVESWLARQADMDGPRLGRGGDTARSRLQEAVPAAIKRLELRRDVVWGYWLANRKYVAVAVLTVT